MSQGELERLTRRYTAEILPLIGPEKAMIAEKEKALKNGARSIYDMALETFDKAADLLNLERDIREHIKYPERILIVNFPVRMDNGFVVFSFKIPFL